MVDAGCMGATDAFEDEHRVNRERRENSEHALRGGEDRSPTAGGFSGNVSRGDVHGAGEGAATCSTTTTFCAC